MRASVSGRFGRSLVSIIAALTCLALSGAGEARNLYPKKSDAEPHHGVRDAKQKVIQGIDISRWQREIDWVRVKGAGTRFAFIKATEGGDHLDEKFRENWDGAKAAGVPRGAYHFVFWCRPAKDQIRWFIRNVPKDPDALPPVLDVEWNNQSRCPRAPAGLARQKMREMLKAFEAHYGKKPIIYTDINFHEDVLEGTTEFDTYPFWIRSTAARPEKRYQNRPWEFWQFTTTGRVPGITGDVDRNAFYGSEKLFTDWMAGRYDIGARVPMNTNARIAQPKPVDPVPRPGTFTPEMRIAPRMSGPMNLRQPRLVDTTGSLQSGN